jgi:phenylacetate-coenzyme A ligase PaaK-like adenylate-forming protein
MGMTESKWAFMECDEETGIHLNPKFYLWEMLDPETRKPVPEGEPGVLTFSHIGWRGTAFIRYYTGDLIRGGMRWDKCPKCGYTYPRITGPIQRAVKDFTKIKGTRVSLSDLIATVRDMPGVSSFQVVIDKEIPGDQFSRDVLKLRITPQPDAKKEALERRLKEKVKGVTEVTPDQIIWEDDEKKLEADLFERTGIKADYIVDKRPVHI